MVNILIEDINWDTRVIWIRLGKGAKERFVPFTHECGEWIKRYLRTRTVINKYIFTSERHNREANAPLCKNCINEILIRYTKKAGLEKQVSPHMFRHSMATHMAEKGAKSELISTLLGHKDLNTTRIYSK